MPTMQGPEYIFHEIKGNLLSTKTLARIIFNEDNLIYFRPLLRSKNYNFSGIFLKSGVYLLSVWGPKIWNELLTTKHEEKEIKIPCHIPSKS